ncbi:MAG: LolA family protein [Methanosarcina sp.]
MHEKENSISDSSYTIYVRTYIDGKKASQNEYDIMYKEPNKKKTIEKAAGKESLIIYDGNIEWHYDIETNSVQKIIIPEEYQNLDAEYSQFFKEISKEFNISVIGTEIIDERNAYRLEAKPKAAADENESYPIDRIEIWVDAEKWIPLKYEVYGSTQKIEIEIKNLKINTGIPDSKFKFKIPEGANITTMNFEDPFKENIPHERTNIPSEGEKETSIIVAI